MDAEYLRYKFLNAWDAALQALDSHHAFLSSTHQIVSYADDSEQASSPSGTPFLAAGTCASAHCCYELQGMLRPAHVPCSLLWQNAVLCCSSSTSRPSMIMKGTR